MDWEHFGRWRSTLDWEHSGRWRLRLDDWEDWIGNILVDGDLKTGLGTL